MDSSADSRVKTCLIQGVDAVADICEAAVNVVVSDVQGFVHDPPASRINVHTHYTHTQTDRQTPPVSRDKAANTLSTVRPFAC